ncbi:Os10g0529600 [Oryza sativa Japonica Group]|uniref:Os10g0529600 protein n=2 Tax=Oryza sativa subsp. japonica TaxID=39947 RepID=Q0IW71_ORYSJ|nr:Os10g0529600 [Oryza sativa Japonica Group]|eukprot:NP_001065130.1 Os10g0529600 [Oryza sativa Japonica Group]
MEHPSPAKIILLQRRVEYWQMAANARWWMRRWWQPRVDPAAAAPSAPSRLPPTADPAPVALLSVAASGSGSGGGDYGLIRRRQLPLSLLASLPQQIRRWWQRQRQPQVDPAAVAPSVSSRLPPTADSVVAAMSAAATSGSGGGRGWIQWRPRGWIRCGREVRGRGGGGEGGERGGVGEREICGGGGKYG